MKTNLVLLLGVAAILGGVNSSSAQTKAVASPPGTTPAASASAPADTAKIVFDTNTYNFGKVSAGEVVRHDFIFTNTGKALLEISAVRPGCGCTTAGEWDKKVEPGKTGKIPLQFNSANFGGTVTKSATVTCNDPGQSNVILQITGTVWKPIDLIPTMATFTMSSETQSNESRIIRIVSNLDEPLSVSDPQCPNSSFKLELKTVQPGKEYALHVTAVPPFTTPTVYAPITMKTSSEKTPTLNLSAYVTVQQAVLVSPQQINLPTGPLLSALTPTVMIRANGTNTLTLSDPVVEGAGAGAEIKVQEIQAGRVFNLTVSFPAGFQTKPDQKTEVKVKSNHPKFPVITVPVFQPQPPARAAVQNDPTTARIIQTGPTPATVPAQK